MSSSVPKRKKSSSKDDSVDKKKKKKKKTGTEKNRPVEMSASKPVGRYMPVQMLNQKDKTRDPRFDEQCGDFDEVKYQNRYGFVNDLRENEIEKLNAALKKKKKKHGESAIEIKESLKELRQISTKAKLRKQEVEAMSEWKRQENANRKLGKKPFYLKETEVKKMNLKKKFESLANDGQLEKYMTKRRKKNAAKDRKWLTN